VCWPRPTARPRARRLETLSRAEALEPLPVDRAVAQRRHELADPRPLRVSGDSLAASQTTDAGEVQVAYVQVPLEKGDTMSSPAGRYLKRGRGITAGLGVILALAVSLTASAFAASGHTQAGETGTGSEPTVVLVHGGWDNSTGWNAVVADLQKRRFDVIAPANPLRDLASDAAYISSVLDTIESDRPRRSFLRRRSDHQRSRGTRQR
jgi:hypothetical protein